MRSSFDADALRLAMLRRGLSVTELSTLSGLTYPTVMAAVQGHALNLRSLLAINRAIQQKAEIQGLGALLPDKKETTAHEPAVVSQEVERVSATTA